MSTGQYADKINWVASKHDQIIISKIADRAALFGNMSKNVVMMDITACHLNGCPLRLFDLLNANQGNFFHDIIGINEHINRETGKLQDLFLPRYHA